MQSLLNTRYQHLKFNQQLAIKFGFLQPLEFKILGKIYLLKAKTILYPRPLNNVSNLVGFSGAKGFSIPPLNEFVRRTYLFLTKVKRNNRMSKIDDFKMISTFDVQK